MVTDGIGALGGEAARAAMAGIIARHPLGRLGEPREIADAALFLASEESSFVSFVKEVVGDWVVDGCGSARTDDRKRGRGRWRLVEFCFLQGGCANAVHEFDQDTPRSKPIDDNPPDFDCNSRDTIPGN